jgi:hypothetical protein
MSMRSGDLVSILFGTSASPILKSGIFIGDLPKKAHVGHRVEVFVDGEMKQVLREHVFRFHLVPEYSSAQDEGK